MALPQSTDKRYDCIIAVVCKFSKQAMLELRQKTWKALR